MRKLLLVTSFLVSLQIVAPAQAGVVKLGAKGTAKVSVFAAKVTSKVAKFFFKLAI